MAAIHPIIFGSADSSSIDRTRQSLNAEGLEDILCIPSPLLVDIQSAAQAITDGFILPLPAGTYVRTGFVKALHQAISEHPDARLIWFDTAEVDDDGWQSLHPVADSSPLRSQILFDAIRPGSFAIAAPTFAAAETTSSPLSWLDFGVRLIVAGTPIVKINGLPLIVLPESNESAVPPLEAFRSIATIIDGVSATYPLAYRWLLARQVIEGVIHAQPELIRDALVAAPTTGQALKLRIIATIARFSAHSAADAAAMLLIPRRKKLHR